MAVLEWVVTMREGLHRMQDNNVCMRMVRYEDLVDSPRQVLAEITSFADFSKDETCLRYGESILSPAPRNAKFMMHPALRPLFDETMQMLGY